MILLQLMMMFVCMPQLLWLTLMWIVFYRISNLGGRLLTLLSCGAATGSDRHLKCIQILQLRTLTIPFFLSPFFSRVEQGNNLGASPVKNGDREKREKEKDYVRLQEAPKIFQVGNRVMYVHTRRAV